MLNKNRTQKRPLWYAMLSVFLVFLGWLFPGVVLAKEDFTIEQYNVTMNVQENHNYQISEDLMVNFSKPRHGIFRTIPVVGIFYREIDGAVVKTPYQAKILGLTVPGENTHIKNSGKSVVVQMGNSNHTIEGPKDYNIRYDWNPGLDNLDSLDDVYFNLIGTDWNTTIAGGSFVITMPKDFDPASVIFITGKEGFGDTNSVDFTVAGRTITGKLNRPLAPNEAVTVKINLPEGYFAENYLTEADTLLNQTSGDRILAVLIAVPLLLGLVIWFLTGRDKKLVVPVTFYPPEGMTPPQVSYIVDKKVERKDLYALLLYWADKGYVTVTEVSKSQYDFKKLKDLPADANNFEQTLFTGFFSGGDSFSTVSLPPNLDRSINQALDQVKGYFGSGEHLLDTTASQLGRVVLTLLAGLPLLSLCVLGYTKIGMIYAPIEMTCFIMGTLVIPLIISMLLLNNALRKIFMHSSESMVLLVVAIVLGIAFGYLIMLLFYRFLGFAAMMLALVALLSSYGLVVLRAFSGKRTPSAQILTSQILGLKKFIVMAEKDRIDALVNEDPQYFFRILPYAFVLGIATQWVDHFADTFVAKPDWYSGGELTEFDIRGFSQEYFNHLTNQFTAAREVIDSISNSNDRDDDYHDSSFGGFSSGGSSGGGFSGGGGGGGGGGSW